MSDRRCFECVDRSFRDILGKRFLPFGGMTMLLGGDFRQTLPVKPKKKPSEIIDSTLPKSCLWRFFTVYSLTYNVRVSRADVFPSEQQRIHAFTTWLLNIGDGTIGPTDPSAPDIAKVVDIPHSLLLPQSNNNLDSLIHFVYPTDILSNPTTFDLSRRAIVCPKNDIANEINSNVISLTPGNPTIYLSNDGVIPHTHRMCDIELLYPPEYLGQLNFSGLPLHRLDLKPNCPILLVRNLNQALGLCNGTRLIISQLFPYVIEATIVTGTSIGQRVYLPRIKFIHKDPELPFVFTRKQFPIKVCYAMTINKSQGQSLDRIGIYLPQPVFSHGQLYVALSRATSQDSLKVLVLDEKNEISNQTKNVVYTSLLAEVNGFLRIAELGYGCTGAALKIRVLRKWIHHSRQSETWFLAVDKYGDAVQILGRKPNQHLLESKLRLLHCYEIEDYTCTQTRNYLKTILNPIHLNLGLASKITEIEDSEDLPRHWFNFASMERIYLPPSKALDCAEYVPVHDCFEARRINLQYMDENNWKAWSIMDEEMKILGVEVTYLLSKLPFSSHNYRFNRNLNRTLSEQQATVTSVHEAQS
ncbi:hypothetical protein LXL04_009711 [Taraxacum kok-saghyz]